MNKIINRAKEPSTWAGLAMLLQAIAPLVPAWGGIIMGISAIFAGVAVKLPEAGGYMDN